ncbi:SMC-Scp complex subunit ScpB [Suicoccus acidiformans]|uniref:Segregation and condensation protein B n=1 Tax=Suicoccus acidiformans TaxID=2036206 RepID=A0A347WL95_9LACT|nr:SMC-Scp complex subunit ScpB [Suicoccus acidiformans]AXY25852.1 SMC-Scp complex subunit ScpB [Suicoccus acidiformans]
MQAIQLLTRIKGILFVAGEEGVSEADLVQVLNVPSVEVQENLQALKLTLQTDETSPIELVNYNQRYRLVTKAFLEEDVKAFAQQPVNQQLSRAAVETLAIVAYRQPITRLSVDEIRGVSSQSMLQKLMQRDLIQEVGRVEAPGRPLLYGVTPYFMDYFGLESLNDLPDIEPLALNAELTSESLFDIEEWNVEYFHQEEEDD